MGLYLNKDVYIIWLFYIDSQLVHLIIIFTVKELKGVI